MTDIALALQAPYFDSADLVLANGDLATDDGLETAVLISLLCRRRADADDAVPPGADRGGWWGDAYLPPLADGSADYIGSKLWLDRNLEATVANGNRILSHIREALAWMISDGVAASIDVTGTWQSATSFAPVIEIAQIGTGGAAASRQFNLLWNTALGALTQAGST